MPSDSTVAQSRSGTRDLAWTWRDASLESSATSMARSKAAGKGESSAYPSLGPGPQLPRDVFDVLLEKTRYLIERLAKEDMDFERNRVSTELEKLTIALEALRRGDQVTWMVQRS